MCITYRCLTSIATPTYVENEMKDDGSFTTNITSSQWHVHETLCAIFKGCLPLFPEGDNVPFASWPDANRERIRLWEFLKMKVLIEHRIVERVFIRYKKVVRDADDIGIKTRSLQCDVALPVKNGAGLPAKIELFLTLRIGMDLLADCDEWHARNIYFIPLGDQIANLFKEEVLEYNIA